MSMQDLHKRNKFLSDNREYFSNSALIIVSEANKQKLMSALTTGLGSNSNILADGADVWADGATVLNEKLIHVLAIEVDQLSKPDGQMSELCWNAVANLLSPTAAFMYRQLYLYEPGLHERIAYRVVRDRTEDLKIGVLIDALYEHHALPEMVRLRTALANHGS